MKYENSLTNHIGERWENSFVDFSSLFMVFRKGTAGL